MVRVLTEKGFRLADSDRDHDYYYFYHKDKRTAARTKVSRGSGYRDYDDGLFRLMCSALRLPSVGQVRDLLRCPLSEDDYIRLLMANGILKDE